MRGWAQKAGAFLASKTFWGGLGLCGLGIYQATQKQYDAAFASLSAALAVWGLRHAIAKQGDQQQ